MEEEQGREPIIVWRGGDLLGRGIRKGLTIERRIPGSGPFRTRPVIGEIQMTEAKTIRLKKMMIPITFLRANVTAHGGDGRSLP